MEKSLATETAAFEDSAVMLNFDLMVAFAAIVAAAEKKPAETIEMLLAKFVFAETASELVEKETAGLEQATAFGWRAHYWVESS